MREVVLVISLVLLGMMIALLRIKGKKAQKKKVGQYFLFEAEGKTAAQCRGLLADKSNNTVFEYTLERAQGAGQYITFTKHIATGQTLETIYLLVFEDEIPAKISMKFVREVFGSKEPVFGEELMEAFFAEKLGAVRIYEEENAD